MSYNIIQVPSITLLPLNNIDFSPLNGLLVSVSNLATEQSAQAGKLASLDEQVGTNELILTSLEASQATTAEQVTMIQTALTSVTAPDGSIAQDEALLSLLTQKQDATDARVSSLTEQVTQAQSDITNLQDTTTSLSSKVVDISSAVIALGENDIISTENHEAMAAIVDQHTELLGELANNLAPEAGL